MELGQGVEGDAKGTPTLPPKVKSGIGREGRKKGQIQTGGLFTWIGERF